MSAMIRFLRCVWRSIGASIRQCVGLLKFAEKKHRNEDSIIYCIDLAQDFDDDQIISLCTAANSGDDVSQFDCVLRLSDTVLVKHGISVTRIEAENQHYAWQMLDAAIVKIPKVYKFFKRHGVGYILMDHVAGEMKVAEQLSPAHYQKLSSVLLHLHSLQRTFPGPVNKQGLSYNCPFTDTGVALNGETGKLQEFFRSRLGEVGLFDFHNSKFVFCHRDFAPRNMIWTEDGLVCLLDWLTAGFYPQTFEICTQHNGTPEDYEFNQNIIQFLSTSNVVSSEVAMLRAAWWNSQKYAL